MTFEKSVELLKYLNNSYNFIPNCFIYNNQTYLVLINLSNLDFKISKLEDNFDNIFFKKYSIFKNNIYLNNNNFFTFKGKNTLKNLNKLNLPIFNSFTNNINYSLKISKNVIKELGINFSYHNQNIKIKNLVKTNFFLNNIFKLSLIDFLLKDESKEYVIYKKLIIYFCLLLENIEVFIKLLYFSNSNKTNDIITIYKDLKHILEDIKPHKVEDKKTLIKNLCLKIKENNNIKLFINNIFLKNTLKNSCKINKNQAFYKSISGPILRASGIDIDFNNVKNTFIGEEGSTWDRIYARQNDINRYSNELYNICSDLRNFKLPELTKKHFTNNLSKIISYENSNGLVFNYFNYSSNDDTLFIKTHFSSINNLSLLDQALGLKSPEFDYFIISLNISMNELSLNRHFIIKDASNQILEYINKV